MLSAENKSYIIQTGIDFMRAITEVYDTDEGMKLWDTIASTLDPSIKGDIFFALLTGEYSSTVSITGYTGNNKVELIKAIRSISGLGLKEAKDLSDEVFAGRVVGLIVEPRLRSHAVAVLQGVKCIVA